MRRRLLLFAALLAFVCAPAAPSDDCDDLMGQLASAQRDAWAAGDVVDALSDAIQSPSWDPVGDGWMVGALNGAESDLIGALNTAAVLGEQAHSAHCY